MTSTIVTMTLDAGGNGGDPAVPASDSWRPSPRMHNRMTMIPPVLGKFSLKRTFYENIPHQHQTYKYSDGIALLKINFCWKQIKSGDEETKSK